MLIQAAARALNQAIFTAPRQIACHLELALACIVLSQNGLVTFSHRSYLIRRADSLCRRHYALEQVCNIRARRPPHPQTMKVKVRGTRVRRLSLVLSSVITRLEEEDDDTAIDALNYD